MINKFLNVLLISSSVALVACSADEGSNSRSKVDNIPLKSKAVLSLQEVDGASDSYQVKHVQESAGKTQKSSSYTIQASKVR